MKPTLYLFATASAFALATPALAAPGDPIEVGENLSIVPILDARLRYETVDQPATNADAVTARLRIGAEARMKSLSILAEAEGTLAIANNYNDTNAGNGIEPYSVVADPENIELNRLQLQYKKGPSTVTIGRQRINLDDQRWVGSVGWRQNEQTFEAIRGETKIGPVSLDATYSISQRTIFGIDAGPRTHFDGNFYFVGAGIALGPVKIKAFGYLLDYDAAPLNSTQTFGLRGTAAIPIGPKAKLNLAASYARQEDYATNPLNFGVDYFAAEAGVDIAGFELSAGYELLGSNGVRAVQTPFATLHKFNGWADVFLATPAAGLQDVYGTISYKFTQVRVLRGLNVSVTYHQFDSDTGNINYGHEWDAKLGFKLGPVAILAKYADYNAKGFGVNTRKFWFQAEYSF